MVGSAARRRTLTVLAVLGATSKQRAGFLWSEARALVLAGLLGGLVAGGIIAAELGKVLNGIFDPAPPHPAVPVLPLLALGAVVVLEMAAVVMTGFRVSEEPVAAQVIGQPLMQFSNTKELGKLLYTQYIYPVQVAAVILLVAMIAAIALTLRERKDTKTIDASEQVRVRAGDRLQVLKMEVTRQAPADAAAPEEKKS